MSNNNLKQINESRWAVKIIARDITELDRELNHLTVKSETVGLSSWEIKRLLTLSNERSFLNEELANISSQNQAENQ
ncbi:MAG: hypothetical protein R3A13_11005 [Bdellovibrionota bacterium]